MGLHSIWRNFFTSMTVSGNAIISYTVLSTVWVSISEIMTPHGSTPANAKGKNMMLSMPSPHMVLRMARAENRAAEVAFLPSAEADCFIFAITQALVSEPARKAVNDAHNMRGAAPNIASMASCWSMCQTPAA